MSTLNVNGRNHTVDADPGWRDSRHWKISTPDVLNGHGRAELARRSSAPLVNSANRTATNVRFGAT